VAARKADGEADFLPEQGRGSLPCRLQEDVKIMAHVLVSANTGCLSLDCSSNTDMQLVTGTADTTDTPLLMQLVTGTGTADTRTPTTGTCCKPKESLIVFGFRIQR
jgi:hypothetical protein